MESPLEEARGDGADSRADAEARALQHQQVINHANRMLSGSAYRRGMLSGLDLLGKLRGGRCKARSPEANLDLEQIAVHASNAVLSTLSFSVAALVVFIAQVVLLLASLNALTVDALDGGVSWGLLGSWMGIFVLGLFGAGLMAFEGVYLRWANARRFLRSDYMPGAHEPPSKSGAMEKRSLARWLRNQVLSADAVQNVVTFGGYAPFVGAGGKISGWVMAVERKPDPSTLEEDEDEGRRISISVEDFYRAVDEAMEKAQLPRLQRSSVLLVKGAELEADGEVLARLGERPVSRLPEHRLMELGQRELTSGMRFYRLYRYVDTARDMVLSYYLRFYNVGAVTFIEASAFTLTGVDRERFGLASLLDDNRLTRALKTAVWTLVLLTGLYGLVALSNVSIFVSQLLEWRRQDARHQRAIKAREKYNYGIAQTFRESVAAPFYQDYYGVQDLTMYWRSVEECVLHGVVELLEERGIDVSQFKEQATTVINSGIMVSGGEFTATQVTAGTGASSIMKSDDKGASKAGLMKRASQQVKAAKGAARSAGASA
ncbi:hypothetical protein HPC49_08865 [Pyxidicoccus fallax]|uniref:Uncharacterized protein n=1 Tax=Pyxidicoccus fallax TaxID=394095 RepID=A0A848L627_9BACT|nr:hypothetical protein [Pyxidicoccus fallax]NMO13957.1 hypothetical protein [Pyxidicoccus fallax]NPC78356.1 hypothetical protein [Pyxidicoccus fallax]